MMTFEESCSDEIGKYRVAAGRRILMSAREGSIRQWEEIGHARADTCGKAFYVVETNTGHVFLTDKPLGFEILRVCTPIPKSNA